MQKPGKKLLDIYDIQESQANNIELSLECIGVIAHLLHQDSRITSAGIFGSRSDKSRSTDKSSDIDIALVVDDYKQSKITDIDFRLNRRYRSITGKSTEIDIACMNEEIRHDLDSGLADEEFRREVRNHVFCLKGSREELM